MIHLDWPDDIWPLPAHEKEAGDADEDEHALHEAGVLYEGVDVGGGEVE